MKVLLVIFLSSYVSFNSELFLEASKPNRIVRNPPLNQVVPNTHVRIKRHAEDLDDEDDDEDDDEGYNVGAHGRGFGGPPKKWDFESVSVEYLCNHS